MKQAFSTYIIDENSPFKGMEDHILLYVEYVGQKKYRVHFRFENGLGLTSNETFNLIDVWGLVDWIQESAGFTDDNLKIDIPSEVLEDNSIFGRKLKKALQKRGLYWKGKEMI